MPIINPPLYTRQSERQKWGSDFDLDHFQRFALDAIDAEHHVLVTAHTGSGKTLPAEYGIVKAVREGKRAIYTAPIKTLSNQKYCELQEKYPDITFGILTGDVKHNPGAQCLIMTTEILRNTLFQAKMSMHSTPLFDVHSDTEIGCIVFDEVHYINDHDRGHVWEEAIMLAPIGATLVMLSATINHPETFAAWVEKTTSRQVEICSTSQRAVPLTHHFLLTYPDSATKAVVDTAERSTAEAHIMQPITVKTPGGQFETQAYDAAAKTIGVIDKAHRPFFKANTSYVLNQTVAHLQQNNLLPAISFVLSRKGVENYAAALTSNLSDDSHAAEKDFESLVRRLGNKGEHLESHEYTFLSGLIRKGIAIHHSGMVPVLREAVELMISKGHVKFLLATETFAVGVNMPAKAVVFTSLTKRSNEGWRALHPHEYTQMAGRAGRRGKDPTGHVIILPALFRRKMEQSMIRGVLCGSAPTIESKFKIHFNLILRLLLAGKDPVQFTDASMVTSAIQGHISQSTAHAAGLQKEIADLVYRFPQVAEYVELMENIGGSQNARRKRASEMRKMEDAYPGIAAAGKRIPALQSDLSESQKSVEYSKTYIAETVRLAVEYLTRQGFVSNDEKGLCVTPRGAVAANIQEVHSLMTADALMAGMFNDLEAPELASLLSCFASVRADSSPPTATLPERIRKPAAYIEAKLEEYAGIDAYYQFDVAEDYNYTTALVDVISMWCAASDTTACNAVFARLAEGGIFKGEFIKATLKTAAVAQELEKVAEMAGMSKLVGPLSEIPSLLFKHVATNQSMYLGL